MRMSDKLRRCCWNQRLMNTLLRRYFDILMRKNKFLKRCFCTPRHSQNTLAQRCQHPPMSPLFQMGMYHMLRTMIHSSSHKIRSMFLQKQRSSCRRCCYDQMQKNSILRRYFCVLMLKNSILRRCCNILMLKRRFRKRCYKILMLKNRLRKLCCNTPYTLALVPAAALPNPTSIGERIIYIRNSRRCATRRNTTA